MKWLGIFSVFLLFSYTDSISQESLHNSFDNMLSQYVDQNGGVDYKSFKNSQNELDTYLIELSKHKPGNNVSKNDKLAYWINLYNAATIQLVLKHYPIKSIRDINKGKPWDHKFIKVGKDTYSLNQIENDIIRPKFNEPRIHFAVNCAAKSCPPLLNKAWKGSTLNTELSKATKHFIKNKKYNTVNKESINISKIFEWYKSDFGHIIRFINKYSVVKVSNKAKMTYNEYNWNLNKQ